MVEWVGGRRRCVLGDCLLALVARRASATGRRDRGAFLGGCWYRRQGGIAAQPTPRSVGAELGGVGHHRRFRGKASTVARLKRGGLEITSETLVGAGRD